MIRFGVVDPEEEIVFSNSRCQLKINSGEFASGTLLMTEREICWKGQGTENGFMIPWEKVTVQAITQDPQRSIYFMLDVSWPGDGLGWNQNNGSANGNHDHGNPEQEAADGSEDEGNDSEGSVQEMTEFYIVSGVPDDIDEIYYVMTKFPAAAPMDDESDDDFFDGENIEQMNINDPDDDERFADAE